MTTVFQKMIVLNHVLYKFKTVILCYEIRVLFFLQNFKAKIKMVPKMVYEKYKENVYVLL